MIPTVAHAKARSAVSFPGQTPGTTMTGRIHAVDLDVVTVLPEPERGVL